MDARAEWRARQLLLEMSSCYGLHRGLHWALCGGHVIFLDLGGDRYFGLNQKLEEAFLRFASGELADDALSLQPLVARGLLTREEGRAAVDTAVPVVPATADFLGEPRPRTRAVDLAAVMWLQVRWFFLLRSRSLEEIATGIEIRSWRDCRSSPGADGRIARLIAAFAASSFVLRAADRCLVRALAFQDLCVRSSIHSQLVFGVRVNPFRAHSWVQLDDKVLIGDYEQVRLFTPIAAFG